ncbi:glycosyltransferase family 4 protein [Flagellimonas maritima]|nr:glycosyltransferase family 4 protein [Allomuricauda aurantiaca]
MTRKEGLLKKIFGYTVLFLKVFLLLFSVKKRDLVYVHFPLYFPFLLNLYIWRGIPLILNFHGSDAVFDTNLKKFFLKPLRPVVSNCQKIIVPSTFFRNKIIDIFGVKEDKCFVYPSGGVDPRIFYPRKKKSDELVFGFVSYFTYRKGWWIFLEALSILKTKNGFPAFKAIIVGDGPDERKILKEIEERKINVSVIPSVAHKRLADIFSQFSVFVFPTYMDESLGLVGIEALMCGVPVISTNIAGPTGYIKNGYNGFFFERENSGDLAKKLIAYQKLDKNMVKQFKENAVTSAKRYESQKVEMEFLKFMEKL